MKNEIVKINAADYGLEENKAKQISDMFTPMLDKMVELEKEYNEVIKLDIESQETSDIAKELRLRYVKVRTGTAEIHKELKSFYLQGGRFVDGWKNAQVMASEGIEKNLMSIEKHYENLEIERINKLQEERFVILSKYELEVIPDNLGIMVDEIWNNFLLGTKTNYESIKEAEEKAEEERIAKEKEEKAEQERIKKENKQLKKEAEEKERLTKTENEKRDIRNKELQPYIIFIRDYDKMLSLPNDKYKKEFNDIKKGAEDHWEHERKEKLRIDKLEKELKANLDQEKKLRIEFEANKLKAERAPDKEKLLAIINSLEMPELILKSNKANQIDTDIREKYVSFKKWAVSLIETI